MIPAAQHVSLPFRFRKYAEAATKDAPDAVQVADRWHLLHNRHETLVDVLRPHHRLLTQVGPSPNLKKNHRYSASVVSLSLRP